MLSDWASQKSLLSLPSSFSEGQTYTYEECASMLNLYTNTLNPPSGACVIKYTGSESFSCPTMKECPLASSQANQQFAIREGDEIVVKCDGTVHWIDETHAMHSPKWGMGRKFPGSSAREDGWDVEKDSQSWIKEEGREAWKISDRSSDETPLRISMVGKEQVEV